MCPRFQPNQHFICVLSVTHVNRILTLPPFPSAIYEAPSGTIKPTGNSKLMKPNAQSPLFIYISRGYAFLGQTYIYGMGDSAISSIIWIASRNRLGMWMVIARKWESTLYTLCSSFDFHTLQIYQISSSYIARYYSRFVRGLDVRRGVDCQHPCLAMSSFRKITMQSIEHTEKRYLRSIERTLSVDEDYHLDLHLLCSRRNCIRLLSRSGVKCLPTWQGEH